jgi:hypothetical protein
MVIERAYSPFTRNIEDKEVGIVVNGRYEKHAHSLLNLYHEVPGWAIEVNILEQLDQEGVQDIQIIDADTGVIYQATLSDFAKYGLPVHGSRDRQLCLPLQYWSISTESELC